MRYFIIILVFAFISCDVATQSGSSVQGGGENNNNMRADVAKVIEHFCKGQRKQIEIAQKMTEYKEKGQLPGEEINAEMDEANKHMEAYMNTLDEVMKKYKGQERTVHGLLKKGQLNCKR
jgi:hypothetical protein